MTKDLRREFDEQREKFQKLLHETRANANEENVHRLRVSTRRLRAAIEIARKAGSDDSSIHEGARHLKKLGKLLGERRELDVLEKDLRALGLKLDEKKPVIETRLKKKKITRALDKIELAEPLRPAFSEILSSLHRRVTRLQAGNYRGSEKLHALRIEIKKIRYSFEIMGLPTEELKGLQRSLGSLHDEQVLIDYLKAHGEKRALAEVRAQQRKTAMAARSQIAPTLASTRKLLGN